MDHSQWYMFRHFIYIAVVFDQNLYCSKRVMNGNKIICTKVINITVLDSLLVFRTSLKKLPKMLGLSLNCQKGFHPYYF